MSPEHYTNIVSHSDMYSIYIQCGPSWRVPISAKQLDKPAIAFKYQHTGAILNNLSRDGVIHEDVVRGLDKKVNYTEAEMQMVLAQLNVLKALIDYQKRTNKYDWI